MQRILKHVMNDEKKDKKYRLAILRMLISSKEISSQRELLQQLAKENVEVTQATLSRDLKQLKVAKAASMNGSYVYVLPNETMYKRVVNPATANEMLHESGVLTITFSGTMGVIKTRPGYASAIAYDIDNADRPQILGTIAGDNTIFIVVREGTDTNPRQAIGIADRMEERQKRKETQIEARGRRPVIRSVFDIFIANGKLQKTLPINRQYDRRSMRRHSRIFRLGPHMGEAVLPHSHVWYRIQRCHCLSAPVDDRSK